MAAAALLARGWSRGRRGAWAGTGAVLSAALAILVLVSGLFSGVQAETEARVADVFTGDLRVTPVEHGLLGPGLFDADADGAALAATGATVIPVLESQMILSRRGFIETLVTEDEQYTFQGPGTDGEIQLGALVGADFSGPAATPFGRHLLYGALPTDAGTDTVPLVVSLRTVHALLSQEERAAFGDRPGVSTLSQMPLEVTAAVITEQSGYKDVIRRPARIVGVFDTGIDTLDDFTAWSTLGAVRVLLGHGAADPVANAFHLEGRTGAVAAVAATNGWATEDAAHFTARHLGQLLSALRTLSSITAVVLFVVPAFLVAHGIGQVLEAQRHEVAVLRAIGVARRTVQAALGRVVAATVGLSLAAAAVLVAVGAAVLHVALPAWTAAPLPMDVAVTAGAVLLAVAVAVASVAVAFLLAVRSQGRADVVAALRAL